MCACAALLSRGHGLSSQCAAPKRPLYVHAASGRIEQSCVIGSLYETAARFDASAGQPSFEVSDVGKRIQHFDRRDVDALEPVGFIHDAMEELH